MSTGLIYFKDGILIAESGRAKIYKLNNELFLEIGPGHNLWALESELKDYIWQLSDKPMGECLEIGLGLGVASKYILSCPKVKGLTTVEINEDVIDVYNKLKPEDYSFDYTDAYYEKRHTIITLDGLVYMYETERRFDFIFIDCYDVIDEDTLPTIADMVSAGKRILKENGIMVGWFDRATPDEFVEPFYGLFER